MLLKLCGLIGLLLLERWIVTCRGLAASKFPSELVCCSIAHAPNLSVLLIIAPGEQTYD